MSQLVRIGCAGVAVIIIAALTSVGLFAVIAGGWPFTATAPKPVVGGAQVLVTIQAAAPTATPLSASTPTPVQTQVPGLPGPLAAPVAVAAAAPPTPTATVTPAQAPQPAPLPAAAQSPVVVPGTSSISTQARTSQAATAIHDGLSVEIISVEPAWQPTDATGGAIRVRDGHELVTVQVRLTNSAGEPRYLADSDFALAADDGARYASRTVVPVREPRLLTLPLLPGDSARGWLTYEVPSGTNAPRLQWSPTRPDKPRAEATYNLSLVR